MFKDGSLFLFGRLDSRRVALTGQIDRDGNTTTHALNGLIALRL
jgi:hypothetical protein